MELEIVEMQVRQAINEIGREKACRKPTMLAAAIMDYCTDQNSVRILCNLLKAQYAKPLMLDFLKESKPMIVWTRQRELLINETGMAEQKLDETLTILWKSMDWVIPTHEPQPDNELERYRRKAEQGDPEAQYQLALCYTNGKGTNRDDAKAVEWYKKSAEQGYSFAQNYLGYCYQHGLGVTKDYATAFEWYKKSAAQGNAAAQNNLGICYANGQGVAQNETTAFEWYRKSAEQGNMYGQYDLADCYYQGRGVNKDYSKAVEWFKKSAEKGSVDAQLMLGSCYYSGTGITKDFFQAEKWFKEAALRGNAVAQFNLGVMYENGKRGKVDVKEAQLWFQKAAAQGYQKAMDKLKQISDKDELAKLEQRAGKGNPDALCQLGDRLYFGEGIEKNYIKAFSCFRQAAEMEYAEGQYRLGRCYYQGHAPGCEEKEAKKNAIDWYLKAARQGYQPAINTLGKQDVLKIRLQIIQNEINETSKQLNDLSVFNVKTRSAVSAAIKGLKNQEEELLKKLNNK